MKVTVCELPNEPADFSRTWERLVEHAATEKSELVLLPEMPFYRWLAHTPKESRQEWADAVSAHEEWISRLFELAPAVVLSTRPVFHGDTRQNVGYAWDSEHGLQDHHAKYYLPEEPGFCEASWYQRGSGDFSPANTRVGRVGFLICTELWFNRHAREYSKQGAAFIACPRATPNPTTAKWVAGGRTAAVVSGAFCLSSNLSGTTPQGSDFAGVGWIIEPEEGDVLGLTSRESPFLTLDIDPDAAIRAKNTYPRYVPD